MPDAIALGSGQVGCNMPQATVQALTAATIEIVCKVLAEAVTGGQIASLIAPLRPRADVPGETKWRRLFNAVAERQNSQKDGQPLLRLLSEVTQPVRFESTASFESTRATLNERLLLSGFRVTDAGKVARVTAATTLGEAQQRADRVRGELLRRDVHPTVLLFCRAELLERNYFHAVLEASKSVADKLRELSGLTSDGAELVDSACGLNAGPLVAFNPLASEWERSEHKGLPMLMKGPFGTYRNVTAHAPKVRWATSQQEALDMLTLTSMLHRRLDQARMRPAP